LDATETVACGGSNGEFKEKLGEARKMSSEVHTKLQAVRDYYKTTIRADILELRKQLNKEANEDQEVE